MRAKPQPRCEHCGKHRGQHSARLGACPTRTRKEIREWGAWHPIHEYRPHVRINAAKPQSGGT